MGVSNRILDKPGPLTDEERHEVQKHPRWTLKILQRVPAFRHFADASAQHHERIDGKGYPWALQGPQLDFTARVLAASDVYEALTADQPYRAGMTVDKTLGIMRSDRGTAYDTAVLDATASLAEEGALAMLAASADDAIARLQATSPLSPAQGLSAA